MKIEFIANLPDIQSVIKIGQDGARIQLDVPESELSKMLPLIACRELALRVTIEPFENVAEAKTAIDTLKERGTKI